MFEDCLCLKRLSQKTAKLMSITFCTSFGVHNFNCNCTGSSVLWALHLDKERIPKCTVHIMSNFLCYSDFYMSLGMW